MAVWLRLWKFVLTEVGHSDLSFVRTCVIVKKWFANRLHHLTNNRFYILRGSKCRFLWWSVFGDFAIRAYISDGERRGGGEEGGLLRLLKPLRRFAGSGHFYLSTPIWFACSRSHKRTGGQPCHVFRHSFVHSLWATVNKWSVFNTQSTCQVMSGQN